MKMRPLTTLRSALAAVFVFAGVSVASAQTLYTPPAGQDIRGVWLIQGDFSTIKTTEGKVPPLNKAAAAVYAAHLKARKAGKADFDTAEKCWLPGVPRIMFANYPFEVLQEPKQVSFIHELHHYPRLVYLDLTLPKLDDLDTLWMGTSAGRWEGDTLVVDTAGFNDKTTLDAAGLPHSTEMKVTEHIKKLDANTFEDVVTIDDPKTYTKTWSTRVTYKLQPKGTRLEEYNCTDSNPEVKALNEKFTAKK